MFVYNEINHVFLVTTNDNPAPQTADVSTISETTTSDSIADLNGAPVGNHGDTGKSDSFNQSANEMEQLSVSQDTTDTSEIDSSYDRVLGELGTGDLLVDLEEGGVARGVAKELEEGGGKSEGGEEKTQENRKPPPSTVAKKRSGRS